MFVLVPKIVSLDRQRQVMASPAMGSQAYRFTGWGKTLLLDYVARSERDLAVACGWGRVSFHEGSWLHQSVGARAYVPVRTCA